jgi:lipopolysaccharide/colanic/teichoic acid biosynthesis glycosyltransferase/FlaA1/EpsC-like NDP-sugar epimerase
MLIAKRIMDIFLSLVGILFLIPLIPIVGLLIKLDSRGPIFYRAPRVGKDMKPFQIFKFRTMLETQIEVGESVSPQYDPRVTIVGRFLRRTKMNELPQFLNVLKGEMTFVGPRPEAFDLAALYPEEAKRVFSVKPGLIGPATILGRNEEEIYPPGVDAKKYYIEHILPPKNRMDLEYIENASLHQDFIYILTGVKETIIGAARKRHIYDNRSQIYLFISDLVLVMVSFLFASLLSSRIFIQQTDFIQPFFHLPIVLFIRSISNIYWGMYSSLIRYISYHEIKAVAKGIAFGTLLLALFSSIFGWLGYSGLAAVIDSVSLFFLLSSFRFGLRFYWDKTHRKTKEKERRRILIYGVCDEGNAACRALTSERYIPVEVVGFIDDAPDTYSKAINGKRVLGNRHHIKALARLYRVQELFIAASKVNPIILNQITAICQESGLKWRVINSLNDLGFMGKEALTAEELDISHILSLKKIYADHSEAQKLLMGQSALIFGPTGAMGLELCRRILRLGCRKLIIVDRYESYLNELMASLLTGFPRESIVPILNHSDGMEPLEQVFEIYQPKLVFHLGMRKYEPFLPVDFGDLGRINYLRTFNLAKVAAKYQSDIFLLASSSMPANGNRFITDSLRIAEIALDHFFSDTHTRLIITRLCDIAENRGGIVSIINNQIRNRESVIIPFIGAHVSLVSKQSAVEFILQALVEGEKCQFSQRMFSCDSGSPIPLIEIANRFANIYGLTLGVDLQVKYINRFGEKDFLSIPWASVSKEPPSSGAEAERDFQGLTSEIFKPIFREFVLTHENSLPIEDWRIKTYELIKLCGLEPLAVSS